MSVDCKLNASMLPFYLILSQTSIDVVKPPNKLKNINVLVNVNVTLLNAQTVQCNFLHNQMHKINLFSCEWVFFILSKTL